MKNSFILGTLLLCLACNRGGPHANKAASDTPTTENGIFGRYSGILRHANSDSDQLVKLDFITERGSDGTLQIAAVLTLHFGGFDSGEYISYRYNDIQYNPVSGTLIFQQANRSLALVTNVFKDGRLEGKLTSVQGGAVGDLLLSNSETPAPTRNLIEPLRGAYQGKCDDEDQILQLTPYRTNSDLSAVGNPFAAYEIVGQMGRSMRHVCPNREGRPCVAHKITSGSYDFFSGKLLLSGDQGGLDCKVAGASIRCNGCQMERITGEMRGPLQSTPLASQNTFSDLGSPSPDDSDLGGQYHGYLHHEYLDQYQNLRLDLVAFQNADGDSQSLQISASAKLTFGGPDVQEAISYKFAKRPYNILGTSFVFVGETTETDVTLKITSIKNGSIKGVWFSRTFGRVGHFVAYKGEPPPLPEEVAVAQALSSTYDSPNIELVTNVLPGGAAAGSENPFSPLKFAGYFWFKAGFAKRIHIVSSSYDFYTGRIALITDSSDRAATGFVDPRTGALRIFWPSNRYGNILKNFEYEEFSILK